MAMILWRRECFQHGTGCCWASAGWFELGAPPNDTEAIGQWHRRSLLLENRNEKNWRDAVKEGSKVETCDGH